MAYLTTPIYYVNDVPHIGHAYTTVIADALARWHRLRGEPTRLITGTDEHGLKVQRAAAAAGLAPATLAERTAGRFRSTWDRLGIAYDDFVRTTQQHHRAAVTELLKIVYDGGFVRLGEYRGRYCVACEAYAAAPVCPVHGRPTEQVSEENYFFRLSLFQDQLADWLSCEDAVRPATRRNEAVALLRQGLTDFSISRTSISWGVPLPWDPGHVAYVWFDALGSYLTAAGWPEPGHTRWWPAHHVIGKDILRFHAIYWPAILLAAGLPLPRRVTVHGFLLQRGEKISKSGARSVALDDLLADFGPDGLRYYLLREHPLGPDGDFSYDRIVARYNADLANTLGNLVSRVTALATGPAPAPSSSLSSVSRRCVEETCSAWERVQPSEALAAVWRLVAATNSYLVAAAPWRLPPGSSDRARILGDALEALRIVAILSWPAIPGAAAEIWCRLGLPGSPADSGLPEWGGYQGGFRVTKSPPLFPRLDPLNG